MVKGNDRESRIVQYCVVVHCDSQSIIHLVDHKIYHKKTKYIDVRRHFMKNIIKFRNIKIEKIYLEENPTNMFYYFVIVENQHLLIFCLLQNIFTHMPCNLSLNLSP